MSKEEFDALINRYLSGQASETEQQLINDFFISQERKEPVQDEELSHSMWTSIENRIQTKEIPVRNKLREPKARISNATFWVATSLAVAVIVVISFTFIGNPFPRHIEQQSWISLDAPNGQKSIVTLPDGTRIFLNGGSFITYPEVFQPEKREVRLSGEAFFEVAPNPTRPFIVTSGDVVTQVLGTSFNIQAFPDKQVSVTVATGRVRVAMGSSGTVADDLPGEHLILTPNDQAVYNPGQREFIVTEVELEKYLAWKDNTLFFEDTSLEDVAKTLERWYNVSITFDNDLIKSCRINGKYKDQSLESVLTSIQYMYHVDFEFTLPNKIRLNGNGCNAKLINSS